MRNPFDLTETPLQCRQDLCNLWTLFIGNPYLSPAQQSAQAQANEPMVDAPCRRYVCYLSQFMNSNGGPYDYTTNFLTWGQQHCGPRFLRDATAMCDWSYRGCSSWGGFNSDLPNGLTDIKRRSTYLDMPNRRNMDSLNPSTVYQFQYLGWTKTRWENRRFSMRPDLIESTNAANPLDPVILNSELNFDVYNSSTTLTEVSDKYPWLPVSEYMCYEDLTEVEKDAVRKLQYTIEGWHLCGDIPGLRDHCDWPSYLRNEGVWPVSHRLYDCMQWRAYIEKPLHMVYGQNKWDHDDDLGEFEYMTPQKKEAFLTLGYMTAKSWDERQIPFTFVQPWSLLTHQEQAAAQFLHYSEEIWNGCPMTSCILRKLYAEEISMPIVIGTSEIDSRKWENLALYTKDNFERIGWSKESWDDGGPPPDTIQRGWDELTSGVQEIAMKYGHRKDTWNKCPDTPCLEKYRYIEKKYNHKWRLLSPRIRRTLQKLGYEEGPWNDKVDAYNAQNGGGGGGSGSNSDEAVATILVEVPDVYRKQWSTLTNDERLAAEFLDFDQFTWNGCAGADQPVTTAPAPPDGLDPFRRIRAQLYMPRSYNEIMSVELSQPYTTQPPPGSEAAMAVTTSPPIVNLDSDSTGTTTTQSPEESTSGFTLVAQQAIARALFCNNPDYSAAINPEQRDPSGLPLCIDRDMYDAQLERISILAIQNGIRLDFEIAANRTSEEISAINLYNRLLEKTSNPQSDFRHDADFQRFSSVGQLTLIPFSETDFAREQKNAKFEELRNLYNKTNACELLSDKKHGINVCPENGSWRRFGGSIITISSMIVVIMMGLGLEVGGLGGGGGGWLLLQI